MLAQGEQLGPYTVDKLRWSDPYAHTYLTTAADGSATLVKLGLDDDGLINENLSLASLNTDTDPRFAPYIPSLLGSFYYGPGQPASAQALFSGELSWYSLAEVMDVKGPLDPRDMAWMYRRLLVALGFTHEAGYAHCGVVPEAVLIQPENHGLVLTGWYHAVPIEPTIVDEDGEVVLIEISRWKERTEFYPPELEASMELDIYMAATTVISLIGGDPRDPTKPIPNVDGEFNRFFAGSLKRRPQDRLNHAWRVQEYFDVLIERQWGKRTFREFQMP